MPYATFSLYKPGIHIITFSDAEVNEGDFCNYLMELEALYRQETDLIVIFDASRTSHLPPQYRTRMGQWIRNHKNLIQQSCFLQVYVLSSPLMRFVLQGIFLIQKPPVSFKTISNLEDAKALAEEISQSLVGVPLDHTK